MVTLKAKLFFYTPSPEGGYELERVRSIDKMSILHLMGEFETKERGISEKYIVKGIENTKESVNYKLFLKE